MLPGASFQRARDPEQKAQRRHDLLAAARRLLVDLGLPAVGLSAIARAAGISKSNVYRYFGSREEILLELLADESSTWIEDLERASAPLGGSGDVAALADAVVRSLVARPLACELISVLAGVLERNTSDEAAQRFKAAMLALSARVSGMVQVVAPAIDVDRARAVPRYLHALIAGFWPMAHPADAMRALLARPDYACLDCDFEVDLRGSLEAMLRGLARAAPPA